MCGIAGIIGRENPMAAKADVGTMLDVLKRRGPDDVGVENWHRAVLGHRRLSIVDLSPAGHQPMVSEDGKLGVVFNGMIYNFVELRQELEAAGSRFRSRTDTEVLLHGYREWGADRLATKLQGMFAFGIWDEVAGKLFLIRDRLGVKPLVFSHGGGEIVFASTVRAVHAVKGGELSADGVAEYLEFGFLTDSRAIYEGIDKVGAGEIIEWHDGTLQRRTYWTLVTDETDSGISFEQAVEETERLFLLAVEKRLQADVPIGALLSGGVDSSLVCWAIAKLGGDVTAFSVGTPGEEGDETSTAVATAKTLGIRHEVLNLSSENPPDIDDLVEAYAEPFACASALGMLAISREVKDSATVLLTGDGGDDVFLGYPEHKHFLMSSRLARRLPAPSAELWQKTRPTFPPDGLLKRATSFLDYSMGGLAAVGNARDGLPVYQRNNMLGGQLEGVSIVHREMNWSIESGRNLLAEFLDYDRRTRLVGEYLPKVDGGTMHYGLEARSPFLDTTLWEYAARLPFTVRLNKGRSKAILREIALRRIGESIAKGKKRGFNVPVQTWLTGGWNKHFTETMED